MFKYPPTTIPTFLVVGHARGGETYVIPREATRTVRLAHEQKKYVASLVNHHSFFDGALAVAPTG